MLHHVLNRGKRNVYRYVFSLPFSASLNCQFQHIESNASITIGKDGNLLQCILVNRNVELTQAAFSIFQGAPEDGQDVFFGQTTQHENACARQESSIHFKAGIFGGGSN